MRRIADWNDFLTTMWPASAFIRTNIYAMPRLISWGAKPSTIEDYSVSRAQPSLDDGQSRQHNWCLTVPLRAYATSMARPATKAVSLRTANRACTCPHAVTATTHRPSRGRSFLASAAQQLLSMISTAQLHKEPKSLFFDASEPD
jgi:hypothetical protein